jgi:hypothetical protein
MFLAVGVNEGRKLRFDQTLKVLFGTPFQF